MSGIQVIATGPNLAPSKAKGFRFGVKPPNMRLPWDSVIAKNAIISRTFIETVGYYAWAIALSRNKFEALERAMDLGMWYITALILPLMSGGIAKAFTKSAIKPNLGIKAKNPLATPFQFIERLQLNKASTQQALKNFLKLNPNTSSSQLGKIAGILMRGKSLIIGSNLVLMAAKGQLYFNIRNLLTEKLSGKEGFAGILNVANDDYLKESTAKHKRTERIKHWVSVITGFTGAVGFPLLLYGIGKSKNPRLLKFKKLMPAFNYNDVVHMPKWVLLCHNIFNWSLPAILNCRDKNEVIERMSNIFAYDFFYFIGDDIMSGIAAKVLQNRYKKQLSGFSLLKDKKGLAGLSLAKSYPELIQLYQAGKAPKLALNLARQCFWWGIGGTTVFLGISTTLLNNYFTGKRVKKEQAELALKKQRQSQASQPVVQPYYDTGQSLYANPQQFSYPTGTY